MLLESWRLSEALRSANIETEVRSADVATPGKTGGPCVRICISEDLRISMIPVTEDGWEALWTFRQGNFHFWPVVRPPSTLCDAEEARRIHAAFASAKKSELAGMQLDALKAGVPDWDVLLQREGIEHTHHEGKLELVPKPIQTLADRLERIAATAHAFSEAVAEALKDDNLHPALLALFFGKSDKGGLKQYGQVALDLAEETIYTAAIRCETERGLSGLAGKQQGGQALNELLCALSGVKQRRHSGKFPNPAIPVVGPSGMAMFSMFRDAATNTRYGLTDDAIVSVGAESVRQAHDALKHVTGDQNKSIYWRAFPSGKRDGRREVSDLLIAYAKGVPVINLFDSDDSNTPEQAYQAATEPVFKALQGIAMSDRAATVLLILLRKISNAQVQSAYCRAPTVERVLQAGRDWHNAQAERVDLCTEPAQGRQPRRYISPGRAARLLSNVWAGWPPKSTGLNGPPGGDILDFFLSEGEDRARRAADLLRLTLQGYETLLTFVGSQRRLPLPSSDKGFAGLIVEADRAAFLITILLHAMGRDMNNTTRSAPYQLGLLLGLVDTLHSAYNLVERGEEQPRSLGGSQLLGIAADSPPRALKELLERIRPWNDWADNIKRPKVPEGAKPDAKYWAVVNAKRALRSIADLAPQLAGRVPEDKLTDLDCAELLLGYLSRGRNVDQSVGKTETQEDNGDGE